MQEKSLPEGKTLTIIHALLAARFRSIIRFEYQKPAVSENASTIIRGQEDVNPR